MGKGRLEAFTDGVMAIIITIMVLELKAPQGGELLALKPLLPIFGSYVLSFLYAGIYWNNHHHLFQLVRQVSGGVMWGNLHLLFWLSLTPFTTAWMGENHFDTWPVVVYGLVLLLTAIAYFILTKVLLAGHGCESHLAQALGRDCKGKISVVLYGAGIGLAFVRPWMGVALYFLVALIWLIPDRRIERVLAGTRNTEKPPEREL